MAMLASLLSQFGLEASEYLVCFERLGVRRVEVCAPLFLAGLLSIPTVTSFDHTDRSFKM